MGMGTTAATNTEMVRKWYLRAIMADFGSIRHRAPVSVIIDGCMMLYRSKIDPGDE